MKIAVFSDSHGKNNLIQKIYDDYTFDYAVFLGDGLNDLDTHNHDHNLIKVSGNCDFFSDEQNEIVTELFGMTTLICHGHKYKVKSFLDTLIYRAKEAKASLVLFGHTHNFYYEVIDGITFINPGSLYGNSSGQKSFVMLNIENEKITINRIDFSKYC